MSPRLGPHEAHQNAARLTISRNRHLSTESEAMSPTLAGGNATLLSRRHCSVP